MPNIIDNLIESWAKGRADSVRSNPDTPVEGLEDWSLSEPAPPAPATPLDAAYAVREAVAAKSGRRPKVDYWKPVAAQALGISRLYAKRWQTVLDAGLEAGLFEIDSDSLRHPFLVALDPVVEEEVVEESSSTWATAQPRVVADDDDDYDERSVPDDWVPPHAFPCGHTNWTARTLDHPDQVEARAQGFCCAALHTATVEYDDLNPLAKGRTPALYVDWRVKGLTHPLPASVRRTKEKDSGPGFPGLCADPETGLYIGGLGNNCRYHHTGPERCVVHQNKYGRTNG